MRLSKFILLIFIINVLSACVIVQSDSWPRGKKKIILSFDDGPSKSVSHELLDVLKKHKVKATFFYVGRNIDKHPDIVKRAFQEGHEIGIHSYDRSFPPFLNYADLIKDIDKTQKAIEVAIENPIDVRLYRPPRGVITPAVSRLIRKTKFYLGYIHFYLFDAGKTPNNFEKVMTKTKNKVKYFYGAAIVFHESRFNKRLEKDDARDKTWLPGAVDEFIIWGKEQGFEFVFYPKQTLKR